MVCTSETIEDNRFTLACGGVANPEVSFSSRGPLEHQSSVRSGQARTGQSDKYQKSMSASVTCQNSHLSDATIETNHIRWLSPVITTGRGCISPFGLSAVGCCLPYSRYYRIISSSESVLSKTCFASAAMVDRTVLPVSMAPSFLNSRVVARMFTTPSCETLISLSPSTTGEPE